VYFERRQSALTDATQRGALRHRHAAQREAMCVMFVFCDVCTAFVNDGFTLRLYCVMFVFAMRRSYLIVLSGASTTAVACFVCLIS
jgi:hypothetical protein